jgi:ABC-type methionine transport system permease subunit
VVRFQGAVCRGVDALVPVVPPDAIARVWVIVYDLFDYTAAGGAFGRLGLGENVISR